MRVITPTELRIYKRCREEHRFAYVLRAKPIIPDELLRFSSVLRRALKRLWLSRSLDEAFTTLNGVNPFVRARAAAMVIGYDSFWSTTGVEVLGVDEPFRVTWEGYALSGRFDAVVRIDGRTLIFKHRNTTHDATTGSHYRTRLFVDDHVYFHFAGAKSLGFEVDAFVYDVLKRPLERPYLATPEERRKYTKAGTLYKNQRDKNETPEAFRHRILKRLLSQPESHFCRIEVPYEESEAQTARRELHWLIRDLLRSQPDVPEPRTVDACERFGRMCPYLDVCAKKASIYDPRLFEHEGASRFSATEVSQGGGDLGYAEVNSETFEEESLSSCSEHQNQSPTETGDHVCPF